MKTDEYPYLPSVESPDAVYPTEMTAAEIRRSHLKHEASVKFVGAFYIFGAPIAIMGGLFAFIFIPIMGGLDGGFVADRLPTAFRIVGALSCLILAAFFIGMGAFLLVVGQGLRGLKSWARMPAIVLSVFGLLAYPLITAISACMLYLLLCAKGRDLFSPEYKQIMEETPDIKHKTHIVVWIFLGLPIALVAFAVLGIVLELA